MVRSAGCRGSSRTAGSASARSSCPRQPAPRARPPVATGASDTGTATRRCGMDPPSSRDPAGPSRPAPRYRGIRWTRSASTIRRPTAPAAPAEEATWRRARSRARGRPSSARAGRPRFQSGMRSRPRRAPIRSPFLGGRSSPELTVRVVQGLEDGPCAISVDRRDGRGLEFGPITAENAADRVGNRLRRAFRAEASVLALLDHRRKLADGRGNHGEAAAQGLERADRHAFEARASG